MVTIAMYETVDGRLFRLKKEAEAHEELLETINQVSQTLKPVPDTLDFKLGKIPLQQDPETVKQAIITIINTVPQLSHLRTVINYSDPLSACTDCTRLHLSGYTSPALRLWVRFMSIDDQYREWEQPYLAFQNSRNIF